MSQDTPLVSCLLVTGSQPDYTARAIFCYQQQSWSSKELVIVGHEDVNLDPLLEDIPPDEIRYIRSPNGGNTTPGKLKNLGLDHAGGDYIIHWNEEDWHHPERIRHQAELLNKGYDACWLTGTLLHLDHPEFVHHPRRDAPSEGYARSLMHRNDTATRYNEKKRNPEPDFFSKWKEKPNIQLDPELSWLMIRSVRGDSKSKPYKRFLSGIRRQPRNFAKLAWLKIRGKNIVSHPYFRLSREEKESFLRYMNESQRFGLITSIS